ncbi:DEAD/DEAH box helicase [Ectopseudomonas mendocina]|uniref:DNA 3'-5' helicase n=1 Tax=Ectopseudomonas mendocina TaxID=300 RepID=A0ABZ2RAN3_ECTME
MPSAVQRYKQLLADVLARYFPNTTAYLRAERKANAARLAPAKQQSKKGRTRKPGKVPVKSPKASAAGPKNVGKASGIYSSTPLTITAASVKTMQEQVANAVKAGVLAPPSAEQWAMIVSPQPLTRVFAGAGSGKSTTLILRVMFMLAHMSVRPEQMTIISFTNASCSELREQLSQVSSYFACEVSPAQAQLMVRTFHSAMAVMAKGMLGSCNWFEQLDERRSDQAEPDNPLLGSRLRPGQQRILKQVYQCCYNEQPRFRELVHRLLGEPNKTHAAKAPMGLFRMSGEFSAVPLYEAFYAQGGFAESIGLDIVKLPLQKLNCPEPERHFAEALTMFWRAFQQTLHEQGLMTFSGAFQQLTERLKQGEATLESALIQPFCHLLIDEFQDISPQIVQWLQAVQRFASEQGERVSLMAIGDDWQSIYGWRGSSPELFMDFDRHFPCKGRGKRSSVLMLATNYRSIEPIIRDAEKVLQPVSSKQAKGSSANRATEAGEHGVKLIQGFDLRKQMPDLLSQIQRQCEYAGQRKRERTAVLILARRNEPLKAITEQLDKKLPVKAYTIHRAKGLQAEVAIILDDCMPPVPHPLRNALYACSGFFSNSYDQAMKDESLRLAYVAITRGVSRVFWYCQKHQGATQLLARKGQ